MSATIGTGTEPWNCYDYYKRWVEAATESFRDFSRAFRRIKAIREGVSIKEDRDEEDGDEDDEDRDREDEDGEDEDGED